MTREIARRVSDDGVTWETVVVEEDVFDRSLPTLILRDSTGGTMTVGTRHDPTPQTDYTVVRDDFEAAADPSRYPRLPEGLYLCGGYVDWVPNASFLNPVGKVATYIELGQSGTQYPEADLGRGLPLFPLADHGNIIEAQTRLVAASGDESQLDMKLDYTSTDGSEVFTWVRWVFWAVKVA